MVSVCMQGLGSVIHSSDGTHMSSSPGTGGVASVLHTAGSCWIVIANRRTLS